jgi:rSAM/selenodomain-associated transferase 1
MKRLMVLMAKQPAAGKTKTRLMPAVSAEQAAMLYTCFLQDKIDQMRQVRNVQLAIAYYPSSAHSYFAQLTPDFVLIEQTGDDLPARLKQVTHTVFERNYDCLVLIDGDTVTLPPDYLQQALDRLHEPGIDVTLGPCEDGGYYAIGMNAPHLSLFDVQMSTPDVTTDTLKQVQNAGLEVSILPEWWDVDTQADLDRLQADLDNHPYLVTTSFLKGLHV